MHPKDSYHPTVLRPIEFADLQEGMVVKVVGKHPYKVDRCSYGSVGAREGELVVLSNHDGATWFGQTYRDGYTKTTRINNPSCPLQLLDRHSTAELIKRSLPDFLSVGHKGMVYTTGSDPELFVENSLTGVVIPAWDFLPGKEESAAIVRWKNSWGDESLRLFWDGFQAEFTTYPTGCLAHFMDSVAAMMKHLHTAAKHHSPHARLTSKTVVDIPESLMEATSSDHAALGCAPSRNIYPDEKRLRIDGKTLPFRMAGCHMHLGMDTYYKFSTPEKVYQMVSTIDSLYGVMSVSLLAGLEDERRRAFYGKAGEHRLPSHGLEYRVPSSATLCHPAVAHLSFDIVRFATSIPYTSEQLWDIPQAEVRRIINTLDVDAARKLIHTHIPVVEGVLMGIYDGYNTSEAAVFSGLTLIVEGAKSHLPCDDLESTWYLKEEDDWLPHSGSPNCCMSALRLD